MAETISIGGLYIHSSFLFFNLFVVASAPFYFLSTKIRSTVPFLQYSACIVLCFIYLFYYILIFRINHILFLYYISKYLLFIPQFLLMHEKTKPAMKSGLVARKSIATYPTLYYSPGNYFNLRRKFHVGWFHVWHKIPFII